MTTERTAPSATDAQPGLPTTMPSSFSFEAVFNCGPQGNCLVSPTAEATIIAVNDVLLKFTGRRREDIVGISIYDAFPGDPGDPADTGEAALRASIGRAGATGTAQAMPAQRYPIQITLPDGGVGYEERYWSAVNTPVFDDKGELICISHSTMDVSDRLRSEASLRQSEGRMRAFFKATADVVYRMSPDWTHMYELDGRGFLKTTARMGEYRIEEYVHPDDLARAREAIAEAIRDKTVFALEHRVLRADRSPGWTYSRAVPMLDANGEIDEWIGTASDITERKLAEEKLKETDRRKDEFLAMLAHELRNPLAPISSAAQLLRMEGLDKPRVQQTSDIIVRQVGHMTSLVDDLLDVSRVTRGLVELDNAALDVREIVTEAVEQSMPLMQARAQHLALDLAPAASMVLGDRKRLVQVVANLVNNAAKYTREGGHIAVRTAADDGHVVLDVIDDGIGIEPRMIERVFDLFAQAEVTSARSSGGLGLGLALVKSIVELHGGTVGCDSAGAGKGSTFSVRLPCLARSASAMETGEPAAAPPAPVQPLRLLVVDDNEDAAAMLGMLLEGAGHEVLVEHSPHRALERARAVAPDVCLLDIGLPEMDGNELAQRLRMLPETAHAVLIAVTGYGQEHDRRRSLASGFDHHLVKPVDTAELRSLLARVRQP